ncbi:MAG: Ig-like domain-containing protein [Turneriella sp.]
MTKLFMQSTMIRGGLLALSLFAANCSGRTYNTFFQPFDLVFGSQGNSSVNVSLLTATPLTNTRVMLTFNKPVSLASGQLVSNYRITDSNGNLLNILAASRDPINSRVVFVDTIPQTGGTTYTVTASGIVGVDSSSLGSSNSATFTAPTNADQTGPSFGSVSALSSTSVEVYFTEAVEKASSETATNFDIYTNSGCSAGNVNVTGAVRDSVNFAKVTLTSAAMTSGTTYYLCATTAVRDIWGNANTATIASQAFVYNASTPRVVSALSGSPTSVLVTFDQAMTNNAALTTRTNYTFAGCGALATNAGTTVTVVSGTQVLLAPLTTGTAGTCTLSVNTAITSSAGVALTAATQSAIFSYSAATDTTAPAVASVQATNSNTVRVTFTEPINDSTVGTGDFSFSPSLTVTGVTCYTGAGNYTYCDVTTSTDQTTQNYSATVSGIQDVAGNNLPSSTTTFTGDGKPYIVAIYPVDNGTVLVEWSEPVGNAASVGAGDYSISGATITGAALYPAGTDPSRYVQLTINPTLTSGTSYTLSVNNPTGSVDSTGNGTLGTVPNGGTFTGPSATTAPQVTGGSSPSPTTLIVNFNEPLNNSTIATGDFALSGACNALTINSATQIQAGVVQLVLAAGAVADGSCTVTVGAGNVSDLAGNAIAGTNNTATFSYKGTGTLDEIAPTVGSVVALSNTEIRVYFSEQVRNLGDANSGNNAANYSFSPSLTGGVQSVTCTATYCTLTLNAPGTASQQYSLTISNIQDTALTPNTMASTTVTFGGIGSSVTAPTLYQAVLINSTTVELSFSEQMALAAAQNTAHYTVSGGNTVSAAVLQADATKVRLTISPGAYGSSNSYTVTGTTGLTDVSGVALGTPASATFNGSATAPAVTNLGDSSDLGVSNSDNITNPSVFPTPGLVFTGTVAANTTVYLYDDGVLVGTAISNSSGNYTITLTSAGSTVTNGNNVFTVATVGPTGLVSDLSTPLTVNYDATAPGNPATAADLATGSDTGISTTDNITSDTTPTLSGSGLTAGDYVYIYDGATLIGAALVDGSGNWTWTLTPGDTTMAGAPADQQTYAAAGSGLSAGAHTITYKVGDTAGNESSASPALNLTIDTTAPTLSTSPLTGNTTLTLTLSENVYNSTGGNLATTDFAIAFAANGGTATGASITGITHTAPSGTVVLTISITGTVSGTETVTVTSVANAVVDAAGNAASVNTGAKTLSAIGVASITGTPTYTPVAPVSGGTTGYIEITWSEGVYTNGSPASGAVVAGDFTVAFTQNAGGNSTAAVVSCVTDTASTSCPGAAPAAGATSMRLQITNTNATSGVETIQVSAASNAIYSATSGVTPTTVNTGTLTFPDRFAPSAPASLDLAAADDTGSSNSDNITSQTANLTISGTAEANSTVRIYLTSSAGTLLQTVTADGSGNWSGDITLSAGVNSIVATARDAANNTSADSAALSITVDTTAPAATGTPDLAAASDLGSSSTDNITNDTTPTFDISCVTGTTVQLYSDAVATGTSGTCTAGTVSLTAGTLAAGSRSITAVQTDPAGNASPASGALVITLDTTADAATGTPDLQAASDTGSSNSDNITNDTTPTFDISCVTGSVVQLYSDAVATGTSATCAGSTVTLTAGALSAGSRSITAVQTDPAGNASPASSALSITIDTTADAAPGAPDLQAASDTGSSSTDNITNDTTPTFDISCVTGSVVQLYSDAVATGTSATCASSTVTLTAGALAAGSRSITAVQTDPAGNASPASSALSITIDTGTPSAPAALNLADADDTGTSNSDNITRNTTALTIDGTSEANATIRIYLTNSSGTLLQTVTANGSGVWSGDITLSEGVNSIVATATDAANNTSSDSTGLSITVDTTAPTNQDTVYAASSSRTGGGSVTIVSSGTASNRVWFAPSGTTTFTAGATMTEAASGTATSILAPATAGSYKLFVLDLAGNISSESTATLTVDNTAPTISSVAPATNAFVNTANVSYTINEDCVAGSGSRVTWTQTGGTVDPGSPRTANLAGSELTAGTKTNIALTNAPALVSGAIYTVAFTCTDAAGNAATAVSSTNVTFDTTLPVITVTSPTSSSSVASTAVNYSNSEICQSGSITWTRTGGSADSGGSPAGTHTQALTGAELNAGAFTGSITNNPTLADGAIYSVAFNCTDRAGNVATTVTRTAVTYSPGPLQIVTGETLDTDNDGKIDTYRVTLNKPVNDSTFPGYAANSLGSVTSAWLVAGYTNVRMIHGSAVTFATDTANDTVIYIRFDETVLDCSVSTQVGCDTDAKPDLTTTASPALQDLTATTIAQVNTGSVTEADSARPILVGARSLGATSLDAIFSEPVDTVEGQTATNYVITGGTAPTVSAATRDGTNTNIVHLTTGTQTGGQAYTLTVNTNVKDLANFNLNSSANSVNFNGVVDPVVSSIVTASATTLTITFNESVKATTAECANQTACALIYQNLSLPVLSAVSTAGSGNNSASYTLTVNPMIEGQAYTTTVLATKIEGVAAPAGRYVSSPNNSATFNGDGRPAVTIAADNATECPANGPQRRVVVQYDQSVLTGGGANAADNAANYSIPNTTTDSPQGCVDSAQPCATGTNQTASSVTSYGGNKFGVNFGAAFDSDASQYVIRIVNVRDSNNNSVAVPTNLTFQCGNDTTAPSLIGVTVVSATAGSTVLLLTFSEAVASVPANTSTNYRYDSAAYGSGVLSAARQSNPAQVQVTFQPALSNGGHQLRTINQQDLAGTPNTIADNGINNVQPFIVNAPTGFAGGPVFTDPFADGTPAGQIIIYDDKLVLGWDNNSSQFFEMNKGLTVAQTITLDADGNATAPYTDFSGYASGSSGTLTGLDAISSGCVGGSSTPSMSGTTCSGAGGTEYIFAGAFNTSGNYQSVFRTTSKSSAQPRFTFIERGGLDASGNTYRSMTSVVFNNYLYVASPHIGSQAPRVARVCALPSGACGNGETSWNTPTLLQGYRFPSIGKSGVIPNSMADSNPKGNAVAIDTMFEYDNDGTGGTSCSGGSCPAALYLANGGRFFGNLGETRNATRRSDGGIIRSRPAYSTAASPPGCNAPNNTNALCNSTVWETITPSSADWLNYVSIPLPYLVITGADWENMLPSNRIIPAMKAVPYMRQAPNGDLYMIRNACATIKMQTVCMLDGACNGGASGTAGITNGRTLAEVVDNNFTANFAATATGRRQVCPPGYEVPQLWVLPRASGGSLNGAGQWQLIASRTFTPPTYPNGSALPSRKATTLSGNTTTCGTAPNNKCERNAHVTLLEFVGNYLYLGFDNQDHGANIWRVDMNSATCTGSASCATSGNYPAESSFAIVNDVLGLDGSATNQRIFSHVTVNDSGKDWLILATRDGTNSMKIYRTSND